MVQISKWKEINKLRKEAETKTRIKGNLKVQMCFDRSTPTLKLFDNTSFIEINTVEVEALRDYLNED